MVARYAPPVSYNFLNLIRLGSDKTTVFEQVIHLSLISHTFANSSNKSFQPSFNKMARIPCISTYLTDISFAYLVIFIIKSRTNNPGSCQLHIIF